MISRGARSRPIRVCVTGAECTGKTTLASALGARLGVPVVQEGGRAYFLHKVASGDPTVYASDIVHVVEMQVRAEDRAPRNVALLVLDTDVFTISVWHERSLGRRHSEIDDLVSERNSSDQRIDLYILAAPDIPFEHDSVRGSEESRNSMHEIFRRRLASSEQPFVEVRGSLEERCRTAMEAIHRFLAEESIRSNSNAAVV